MNIDWHEFTAHHWKTEVCGDRLDYWPSKRKWQYQGQTFTGDVEDFIERTIAMREQFAPGPEEQETEKDAWWSFTTMDEDLRIYIVHPGRSPHECKDQVINALRIAAKRYKGAKP